MTRLIVLTFLFLAFAFYELSGGSQFDPVETRLARIDAAPEASRVADRSAGTTAATRPEVSRVALNLTGLERVVVPETQQAQVKTIPAGPSREDQAPITAEMISERAQQTVLPSLITGTATVTPVEFGRDTELNASSLVDEDALAEQETPAVDKDIRAVTGTRVNMREGPGTDFSVISSLVEGDKVEVLLDPGNGWVKLRPMNGSAVGWMADFLLSDG